MGTRIDQTLHGYAHGHSLLQSSIRLSSDAERLMLSLSDMSGPGMRPGFESYLTGYSLPMEPTYVVARTWYASEMQRPGCVWTHSLLIRNGDLDKIRTAGFIARLFRRPTEGGRDSGYDKSLAVGEDEFGAPVSPEFGFSASGQPSLHEVLWSLYARPEKAVYVAARRAVDYELLILGLWLQQWPDLRRAFSFCTGALANRTVKGRSLDVQVVPKDAFSELRQELATGTLIEAGSPHSPLNVEWLIAAVRDISSDWDHRVRATAWSIATQNVSDRGSFPAVFHFASVVERRRSESLTARDYVRAIAAVPSELNVPSSLWNVVFGAPDSSGLNADLSDRDILKALATENIPCVKSSDLRIASRAEQLWKTEQQSALELFWELIGLDSTTEIGNEILVGICRALEPEDLDKIAQMRPGILKVVVRQKPQLAASPAIWKLHDNAQAEIFHDLMAKEIDSHVMERIVGGILLSHSEAVPEHAFRYGDRLVRPILDWLNENGSKASQISRVWTRYLRSHTDRVVGWLRTQTVQSELIVILAASLPADAASVNALDLKTWQRLLEYLPGLAERDAIAVSAFLFALGLRHCDAIAMEFVRDSFDIVHGAARRSILDYEYWRPIENIAPTISFWRDWDKCERMRAALLGRFMACDWQPSELLKAIKAASTLDELFVLSSTTKPRKKFLKRTANIGLETSIPQEYRKVLERYK